MSPHAIDDDCSGWAQQQRGHDDNGGQDDEDNNPDIQDVLGKHDFHGDLADCIHVASLSFLACFLHAKNVFLVSLMEKQGW